MAENLKNNNEPTFVDQAFAIQHPEKHFNLTIYDHKLIEKRLELEEDYFKVVFKEFHDEIFLALAEKFIERDKAFDRRDERIEKKFDTIIAAIQSQTNSIEEIKKSLESINIKIASIQKQQKDHGRRIKKLEEVVSKIFKEHQINH